MENDTELINVISRMIKGQLAFGGGFNSEEDIRKCARSILFGIKLSTEEEE